MINKDELARKEFETIIQKNIIGPGSDLWGFSNEEEVISGETPYQRYSSAILFPKIIIKKEDKYEESNKILDEYEESNKILDEYEEGKVFEDSQNDLSSSENIKAENIQELYSPNSTFLNNMGLHFCLDSQITSFNATFSFGVYYPLDDKDVKIFISERVMKAFLIKIYLMTIISLKSFLSLLNILNMMKLNLVEV